MASGLFLSGKYDDALGYLIRIDKPKMWDRRLLAAIHAERGEIDKAKEQVAAILSINPDTTLANIEPSLAYKKREDVDRFLAALRRAGTPY